MAGNGHAKSMFKTAKLQVFWPIACWILLLAGCSTLQIDKTHNSSGFDSRVGLVVLHYTAADFAHSVELLVAGQVSSHYLIKDMPPKIYQLVGEEHRAWHAGESSWHGRTWLNASSIGIELVYPGYIDTGTDRQWPQWPEQQIDLLVLLLKDIYARHALPIDSIVAHSDIAPQRKKDPGPMFPWARLAAEGLISWPDKQHLELFAPAYSVHLPDADWFQQSLRKLGYEVKITGQFDEQTSNVLDAVQMKYLARQSAIGKPDALTAAVIQSLLFQQAQRPR